MRSLDKLIKQLRKQTENEEFSSFTGIPDSEFVQYINDAQEHIQAAIVSRHPRVFIEEALISAVKDQERYALPSDCFLGNKVHNVEYSPTGQEEDYYVLDEDTIKRRNPGVSGSPVKYIRMAGEILLTPQPQDSNAKIRINYVKTLRKLGLKAAEVSTQPTISSSTTFNIDLNQTTITTDTDAISEYTHLCVVDDEGKSVVKNIKVSSITSSQIVCEAHTVGEGETNTSIQAGNYIVPSKDSTHMSDLDSTIERFLIVYAAWKILKRDSSVDSQEAVQEIAALKDEIVNSYANITDDIQYIPQLNSWDDWSV